MKPTRQEEEGPPPGWSIPVWCPREEYTSDPWCTPCGNAHRCLRGVVTKKWFYYEYVSQLWSVPRFRCKTLPEKAL